jgi:hypothetical protein
MLRLKMKGNRIDLASVPHPSKPSAQRHAERIARDAKKLARRERDGKFIHHTKGER